MESETVLRVRSLTKKYRGRRGVLANDAIDLEVRSGEVLGLLGHNGAGKTTLVNQLVGLVRPDSGQITLGGIDAIANPHVARTLASIQAQANVPITGLTPRVAIELVGRIRGGSRPVIQARTRVLIDALDIGQWADTPAQKVSGGIARLTAFCMTAVEPGRLVVLDEPTNDVDPVRRRLLWDAIRALADNGAGVLLVTHNVREAERVVDRLVILNRGAVIASDTPAGLTATRGDVLTIELDLTHEADVAWPARVMGAGRSRLRATATLHSDDASETVRWAQAQVGRGVIERYALTPASLEDAYIALAGTEHTHDDAVVAPAAVTA